MQGLFFRFVVFVLLCASYAGNCLADIVTGNISADTVWTVSGNPWIIRAPDINNPIEEITVGASTTLTIEPGVVVQIDGAISIRILGTLIAQGTLQNPITFQSFDPNLTWRYLEFANPGGSAVFSGGNYVSGSILEYVNIDNAGSKSYGNALAKAALYLNGGRPFINNVRLNNNTASGIYIENINNYLKITSSVISNNNDTSANDPVSPGYHGGGITVGTQMTGANIEITYCNITGNSTLSDGGGILVANNVDNLTLTDNTIADNVSGNNGGGMFLSNLTGIATNYAIERNIIQNNTAENRGGAVSVENSNLNIFNNRILDNMTNQLDGGGIFLSVNANVNLDSNIIAGNLSGLTGGGVYVGLGSYFGPIAGNNINITNNIFADNDASTRGGGLYVEEDTLTISNNVFSENSAGVTGAALQVESGGTISRNTITRHNSNAIVIIEDAQQGGTSALTMQHNSVVYNDAAIDVILNASGNGTGMLPIVDSNNIFSNGAGFYVSNTVIGMTNMTATNNWFATTDPVEVASNIDGLVDYAPFAMAIIEDPVPVTPPINVTVSRNGTTANLSWTASPETTVTAYTVYWGTMQAPFYQQSMSAGTLTTATITGLNTSSNYYYAVTASDTMAATVTDDPSTTINERQLSGHESWFSEEVTDIRPPSSGGGGGGGSFGWLVFVLTPFLLYRRYCCRQV